MKSELKLAEVKTDKPFPKMMIDTRDSQIILFHEQSKGVVVYGGKSKTEIGFYYHDWDMDLFEDLPSGSTVTLTE